MISHYERCVNLYLANNTLFYDIGGTCIKFERIDHNPANSEAPFKMSIITYSFPG